ncbi:uncharacterized protein EMH_0091070 [Eimeria mitis]|uniref:Uncharacterized protein n=1 Tax=Eimeria mitis TaxID=44415 RepID=U6K958_9EIME|nr:uncharacterized protein EMH_0091070 [Eimeria mitis]CDJ34565.1 hypothetical protein, conserved [Eimeria mitis]
MCKKLESELDDALRLKKRLEKAQAVSLSQLQLLQQQQQKAGDQQQQQQQQQQQINQLIKHNAELEATVKDLTESKDKLTQQLMQLFSKTESTPDSAQDLKKHKQQQ